MPNILFRYKRDDSKVINMIKQTNLSKLKWNFDYIIIWFSDSIIFKKKQIIKKQWYKSRKILIVIIFQNVLKIICIYHWS
jgi:hypothetical protein